MLTPLCIKSDFKDYYDGLSSNEGIIYNRYLKDCKQRGGALKYLRSIGIKTLDIKQVSKYYPFDGKLVVYTDANKHNGLGKRICTYEEAISSYGNYAASKYYKNDITVKFLQIGKRRFTLTFRNEIEELKEGKLIAITESEPTFNRLIGIPIFSIDYIQVNDEMVATDFNEVQNLQSIGMYNYITASDVLKEIEEALYIYNKVERTR